MLPNVLVSSEQMIGALLSRVCADFRDFVLDFVARQEGIYRRSITRIFGVSTPSRLAAEGVIAPLVGDWECPYRVFRRAFSEI